MTFGMSFIDEFSNFNELTERNVCMEQKHKKWLAVGAVCAAILLTGSTVMSALTFYNQTRLTSYFLAETRDVAQEDDVKIAGEYVVKSTLPISDAYKSGDTSKLSDRDKETLDMAKAVMDEVITDDMTDYEKEQAIYRYLTKGMKASTSILTVIDEDEGGGNSDNPHDVLKNHSAVCVGYATTFRLFMQMMDIECMVVHSSDLVHTWNLIRLDDGCWYHTDCYMDSGDTSYANFNMDDTACAQGHEWNRDFFPAAKGSKYNYILSICEQIKDIYAVPEWVMKAVTDKKEVISCTFEKDITEETEHLAAYMAETMAENLNNSDKLYASYRWLKNGEGKYVLTYSLEYIEDDADSLSEKTREKVDNKIQKVLEKYDFYEKYFESMG